MNYEELRVDPGETRIYTFPHIMGEVFVRECQSAICFHDNGLTEITTDTGTVVVSDGWLSCEILPPLNQTSSDEQELESDELENNDA